MACHAGQSLALGDVGIGVPPADLLRYVSATSDVAPAVTRWFSAAQERDDVYYFAIYHDNQPVGQIVLHDIDQLRRESLVAYHLFEPRFCGHGVGTAALTLLQTFVREDTDLRRLVVITSDDNPSSRRVAQKCGFVHVGPSREDPTHGMVFVWNVACDDSEIRLPSVEQRISGSD